ncbi:acyltransferase family protein [Diaphorobacter aerolatus]|nr:acyltransferase [Diaphorobacter aerolatus]
MTPPIVPFNFAILPKAVSLLGFAGVDIFFVISGIIMAETTRGATPGWKTAKYFILQRFGRIYIGWWPFFIIYFIIFTRLNSINPQISVLGSIFLWPQDLTKYLLAITWTLSFELYFYLMIALIILWNRVHATKILMTVGVAVIILNIFYYVNGMYLPQNESIAKKYLIIPFYTSPLIIEFICGFFVADIMHKKAKINPIPWALAALISVVLAYFYQMHGKLNQSGMAGFFHVIERVIFFGTFAVCLCICALGLEKRHVSPFKALQRMGDASYSIYLSHIFFIALASFSYFKLQGKIQLNGNLWWLFTVMAILFYSWFHFLKIEKPLHEKLKAFIFRHVTK